jgi:hypothetical protein
MCASLYLHDLPPHNVPYLYAIKLKATHYIKFSSSRHVSASPSTKERERGQVK